MPRHLYKRTGEEAYGSNKRDARKEHLIFSVTEQLRIISNSGLGAWMRNNQFSAIKNCLPPDALEVIGDWEQFIGDVRFEADKPSKVARERGTHIHNNIDRYLNQKPFDASDECVKALIKWCEENVVQVHWTERVLIEEEFKWAGKSDAFLETKNEGDVLVDWKSTGFKENDKGVRKARFWDSYRYQLAAYRACLPDKNVGCLSVLVDTGVPGEASVQTKSYSEAELADGEEVMRLAAALFAKIEKYDSAELNLN